MHILCVYFPSRAVRFPQISKVGLLHAEFLLCSSGEYLGAKTGGILDDSQLPTRSESFATSAGEHL